MAWQDISSAEWKAVLDPGFSDWHTKEEDLPPNAMECATRARLIWLDYWCDWAVKNCEHPIIANS